MSVIKGLPGKMGQGIGLRKGKKGEMGKREGKNEGKGKRRKQREFVFNLLVLAHRETI